MTWPQFYQRIL
ncbi:Protein of unknown function [Cotesia congregata]|uniref:Uncharacterized protein n=1 Tax=Cotesia congregata TaxID=51543 RepID=A0A8J2HM65_COTCN|nr:Protein of unknown function [Cotesia congregata]